MKQEIKPISMEEIGKLELVDDASQSRRFNNLVRKVVNFPKKEIDEREKEYQTKKDQKRLAKS